MADMAADGIVLAVVVVFELGIGLIAVDDDDAADAVDCCANALSCEFIDSVGDCTGAANAGVGIVNDKLRMKIFIPKKFVLLFFGEYLCSRPLLAFAVCVCVCVPLDVCTRFFEKIVVFFCGCCLCYCSN